MHVCICRGFPVARLVKNSPVNARDIRDAVSIPGSGRSPGEGNGNPLQYSCLVNLMVKGAWQGSVHGVKKSWIRLNVHTHMQACICIYTHLKAYDNSSNEKFFFFLVQTRADFLAVPHWVSLAQLLSNVNAVCFVFSSGSSYLSCPSTPTCVKIDQC